MKELLSNSSTMTVLIEAVLLLATFLLGRYVVPNIPSNTYSKLANAFDEVELIIKWANKYVLWAREFLSDNTGDEKMDYVVDYLNDICIKYNIEMDREQLEAITQECYDNLIGKNKNENQE